MVVVMVMVIIIAMVMVIVIVTVMIMVIVVVVYTDWIVKVFLPGSIKPGRWLITIKVLSSKGPPLVTPLMINRYKSITSHWWWQWWFWWRWCWWWVFIASEPATLFQWEAYLPENSYFVYMVTLEKLSSPLEETFKSIYYLSRNDTLWK